MIDLPTGRKELKAGQFARGPVGRQIVPKELVCGE